MKKLLIVGLTLISFNSMASVFKWGMAIVGKTDWGQVNIKRINKPMILNTKKWSCKSTKPQVSADDSHLVENVKVKCVFKKNKALILYRTARCKMTTDGGLFPNGKTHTKSYTDSEIYYNGTHYALYLDCRK